MNSKCRQGFSRFEVVALGGIALLTGAILWPAIAQKGAPSHNEEIARINTCERNLWEIGLAMRQYVDDYDDKYPSVSIGSQVHVPYGQYTDERGKRVTQYASTYGWVDVMQPYIRSISFFQCPSEFSKVGARSDQTGFTDYWFNRNLARKVISFESEYGSPTTPNAENIIECGDGDGRAPNSNARYSLTDLPEAWRIMPSSPAKRHVERGCYLFMDGHVATRKPEKISLQHGAANTFAP